MPIIFPLIVTIKRQINRQNIGLRIIIKTQSEPRAKAVHGFAHLLRKEWKVDVDGEEVTRDGL